MISVFVPFEMVMICRWSLYFIQDLGKGILSVVTATVSMVPLFLKNVAEIIKKYLSVDSDECFV